MGQKCVHCGEDCGRSPVIWDRKPFCCFGCKTVYQILNEKKLDKYYEIQPMSGIKIGQKKMGDKYAYLDNEEIAGSLLEFSDGGFILRLLEFTFQNSSIAEDIPPSFLHFTIKAVSKVILFVPTIHCAS